MAGGTIVSITPDRRGGTLATATAGTDATLVLEDATDFDEAGGWLVVADSLPLAYTGLDDDTETITLLGTAGAIYEAGLPVDLWDPTVHPDGAKVVEYKASVDLGNGVHPGVVIPHEKVPLAGTDALIGASVTLTEDDEVDQILAREAVIDQSNIDTPYIDLSRTSNTSWPDSSGALPTFTQFTGWTTQTRSSMVIAGGIITPAQAGLYLFVLTVRWAGNSSGRRIVRLMSTIGGVDTQIAGIPASPPDADPFTQQVVAIHRSVEGETFKAEARQSSGAALDVLGDGTTLQVVRLQA